LILPGNANQYFINQEVASYWDFLHNGSDWSIFLAFKSLEGNSAGMFFTNINFGSVPGIDFFLDNRTSLSRSQQLRYRVRGASSNIVNNGLNNSFTASTEDKVASNYDYTNLSIDVYKNSNTLLGSIANSSGASATSAPLQLRFFCTATGDFPSTFLNGELKGLVITQDLLTSQEITDLNTYFS